MLQLGIDLTPLSRLAIYQIRKIPFVIAHLHLFFFLYCHSDLLRLVTAVIFRKQ